MAANTFKSSLNVKSLGNPRDVIGPEVRDGEKVLLGTVYGVASGLVKRSDPKNPGKEFIGLKGNFEALSVDGRCIGASSLFAPDAIHDKIAEQLKGDNVSVQFAFEAYVVKGGTAGFTWEYTFLNNGEPDKQDMLSDVRKLVRQKPTALQLAHDKKSA